MSLNKHPLASFFVPFFFLYIFLFFLFFLSIFFFFFAYDSDNVLKPKRHGDVIHTVILNLHDVIWCGFFRRNKAS